MGVKALKREWFTLLVIAMVLALIVYALISSRSTKEPVYPPLSFHVDKTLLGATVSDATLQMRMSMPKGWSRINEVTFSHIFDRVDKQLRRVPQRVYLLWIYLQQTSGAACCVSSYEDASLEKLLVWWATNLKEMYPSANVMQTSFQIADIPVHQFMINTRDVVHIKLICEISKSPLFAVDYLIPKGVYVRELRSTESSIGSIQIVNNE